jgi:YD repeat-containing protein
VVVAEGFPDGEQVHYSYDASGAQVSITAAGQPIVTTILRNPRGRASRSTTETGPSPRPAIVMAIRFASRTSPRPAPPARCRVTTTTSTPPATSPT